MHDVEGLIIEGFKAYASPVLLPISRCTLLFGANSSGKTSALQALLCLAHSAQTGDFPEFLALNTPWFDLGSFGHCSRSDSMVIGAHLGRDDDWDHQILYRWVEQHFSEDVRTAAWNECIDYRRWGRRLVFKLEYDDNDRPEWLLDDPLDELAQWLPVGWEASFQEWVEREGVDASARPADSEGDTSVVKAGLERGPKGLHPFLQVAGKTWTYEDISALQEPEHPARRAFEVLATIAEKHQTFAALLKETTYLGPVLDPPMRLESVEGAAPQTVGHRGQHLAPWLSSQDGPTVERINERLRAIGCPYNVSAQRHELGSARAHAIEVVLETDDGLRLNPCDVGFGVTQLIPMVCEVERNRLANGLLIIEQPELHLHPAWQQALLTELFLYVPPGQDPAARSRVIAETHSEHLILQAQVSRLENPQLYESQQTAVVVKNRGGATIETLSWDPVSQKPVWPAGFFKERSMLAREFRQVLAERDEA